jgi:hypothetical protein
MAELWLGDKTLTGGWKCQCISRIASALSRMLTQLSALAICQLCLGIQHGRETEIDPADWWQSNNEGVAYNFALFDSTHAQKEGVESLRATKHQIQEHMPSMEEIGAFLERT